jgi:hypothetical protein
MGRRATEKWRRRFGDRWKEARGILRMARRRRITIEALYSAFSAVVAAALNGRRSRFVGPRTAWIRAAKTKLAEQLRVAKLRDEGPSIEVPRRKLMVPGAT